EYASIALKNSLNLQKIEESEMRFKALFEHAGDYIFVLKIVQDEVPIIQDANYAALRFHGYAREELIGKPITIIDKGINAESAGKIIKKMSAENPLTFQRKHQRKDGSVFDVESSCRTMTIGKETFIVSIERDITERKKAEEALIKSETNFKA